MGKTRTCPKCEGKGQYAGRVCNECEGTGHIQEGYLFAELRFCPFQIVWILANEECLDYGKWPDRYSPFDERGSRQIANEGYFVKAKLIIAEVRKRMETTGKDGRHLADQCKLYSTPNSLDDEAWEVLMYLKGANRKDMDFNKWRNQRRYRTKKSQNEYQTVIKKEEVCIGSV